MDNVIHLGNCINNSELGFRTDIGRSYKVLVAGGYIVVTEDISNREIINQPFNGSCTIHLDGEDITFEK